MCWRVALTLILTRSIPSSFMPLKALCLRARPYALWSFFLPGFYSPGVTMCSGKNNHREVCLQFLFFPLTQPWLRQDDLEAPGWFRGTSTAHFSSESLQAHNIQPVSQLFTLTLQGPRCAGTWKSHTASPVSTKVLEWLTKTKPHMEIIWIILVFILFPQKPWGQE